MPLSNGQRLGSFEVLAPLGAGGMGEVYRARDTRLGREVALKVLPESLASDRARLSRFEQEARAASALNHPNIVTIHEIGRDGDVTFIAMELVDGKTLRETTISGALPVRKALGLAVQVAEGLAKAHAAGIVHRDLKPENVMVSKDGYAKILDFGLAKLTEPRVEELSAMPTVATPRTTAGTVLGTVAYMSPEQASGETVDYRSDQFSLGSMLYEMVTGKKAFQKKTAAETMSAIIREEPEPPGTVRPELPLPVRWILERCLAKDREERYTSTKDLARELAGLRDHISEASSGSGALAPSTARRRPRWTSAAAAIVLATAAGAAGWWLARSRSGAAAPSFKRLTFQRVSLGNARFAPDGHTIVYGASAPDFSGVTPTLYLMRLDSPESKPFEFPGDILSMSKSSELAIYNSKAAGGYGMLEVAPLVGGAPRPLVENVAWAGADWDASGKRLAVIRQVDGVERLEYPLGTVLASGSVAAPRFSPDGREIAFWETSAGDSRLTVIDPVSKKTTTLTSGWTPVVGGIPCWRADGEEVWFTASKPGETDSLWAVRRRGGVRHVVRVPGVLELYDMDREGRVLIGHHTINIRLVGVRGGNNGPIDLAWLDQSSASDLSADGTTLLITEDGEGSGASPTVYLRTTDGAPATKIGDGEGVALSPDKKWVLTRRSEGGRRHFSLVPSGPGEVRRLPFEGLDVQEGAFTPDGTRIVFNASNGSDGRRRIYVADLAGGAPRPLGPEGARIPSNANPVSPDGTGLVVVRGENFVVLRFDGGESRVVPGCPPGSCRVIQWSADSRAVYMHRFRRPLRVELMDVETGAVRLWKEIPVDSYSSFARLRITPAGDGYVYTSRLASSELYLVEGLR